MVCAVCFYILINVFYKHSLSHAYPYYLSDNRNITRKVLTNVLRVIMMLFRMWQLIKNGCIAISMSSYWLYPYSIIELLPCDYKYLLIYSGDGYKVAPCWKMILPNIYENVIHHMMTSSNGNLSRVTGPLCGEFTGPGEFPTQRPVTRSFDVFFDLRLDKRLSKQPWGWWFEPPSWSLWRHRNDNRVYTEIMLAETIARMGG